MLILVNRFSYTPHTSFYLVLEINIHHDVFVRSFFYSPRDGFSEELLLLSWC